MLVFLAVFFLVFIVQLNVVNNIALNGYFIIYKINEKRRFF